MSFRTWLSVVTFVLLAAILYLGRNELADAWGLLAQVNLWILALLIPVQLIMYYSNGEMIFEYLRAKKAVKDVSRAELTRMSLEVNFVNHTLPSGGVSGVSYMTWRLGHYGVSPGRAAMSQVVRYAVGFAAFITLLFIAIIAVTIDGNVNRWIILVSCTLVFIMTVAVFGAAFLISNQARLNAFSAWLVRTVNKIVTKVTFGRRQRVLTSPKIQSFFDDLHDDYLQLRKDKRILIKPFIWGIIFTIFDVGIFLITFWALGTTVNPAPVLIAYGLASMAGFFVATPGGAGAYEALMVAFLTIAGVPSGVAIAGIVLARVIQLLTTIVFGYAFNQHAILKYGKGRPPIQR